MDYSELDSGQFTSLHTRFLKTKGGGDQIEFLRAVKDSDAFVEYMEAAVSSTDGKPTDLFPGPLTESSFKEMTHDQERTAYVIWTDVPPRMACRVSFWGKVTLEHIRAGKIQDASWLAMNGGTRGESGEERIDRALATSGEQRQAEIDNCVRTVFRRMSGLPAARGNRSVYVDSTLGRAWWRGRIVDRITRRSGVKSREAILATVRLNLSYWEQLVTMIVSRGSVFGSVEVQDAVINSLAKRIIEDENSRLRIGSGLRMAMRRISNIAAAREMGVLTFEEVGDIIDEVLILVDSASGASTSH